MAFTPSMFCNLYFRYYLISGHNQNSSFITYKHNSLFVFNANQILSIDRNNSSMTIVQLHSIGTTTNKKILWLLHMLYFFFHSYCLIILLYWLNELNMSTGKFPINQLLTQERFFVNRNNWPTSLWLTKKKKKFFTEKWRFRFRSYIFFFNELSWFDAFARDYETIIWNETHCIFVFGLLSNSTLRLVRCPIVHFHKTRKYQSVQHNNNKNISTICNLFKCNVLYERSNHLTTLNYDHKSAKACCVTLLRVYRSSYWIDCILRNGFHI